MLIDAATLPDGGRLDADVAVVGAGPAGIVTALELARAGVDVLLVESGGERFDARTQALGDEASRSAPHVPLSLSTRRQVGGATNLWGGRCLPFDPIDFEPRPEVVGDAAWPVTYDDVRPYFQRAADWCLIGRAVFDATQIPELAGRTIVPGLPDGDVVSTALERWSLPTNFGRVYRDELRSAPTLRLVTGLTVVEVVRDGDADRVERLRARTLDRREISIHARRHVLAAGGLESTRLLLASGIGDHSGHLGRHYMAHVDGRIAVARFDTPPEQTIVEHERDADGVYVRRRFALSADLQRRENLPNIVFWLVNPELGDPRHGSGILSFVYLALLSPAGRFFIAEGIRRAHIDTPNRAPARAHLGNLVRDLWPTVRFAVTFGWRRFVRRGRKVPGFFVRSRDNAYPLNFHGEHLPSPDSRVTLADEADELGLRRLAIDLRFDDRDVDGVLRAHEALDAYLRRHGVGRLEYLREDREQAVRDELYGGYHQSGTTRMSARPEDGVVDPDLAVHGFDDLYVAAGSTFPTSGQANTTFMEVVFALRLADHLRAS